MVVIINVHTQQPTGWDQQDTSSVGLCINTLYHGVWVDQRLLPVLQIICYLINNTVM